MLIKGTSHLSYCTNIHPGESWELIFKNLEEYCVSIKKRISPDMPFGIGLRLSNQATIELLSNGNLLKFKKWLIKNRLYVFTINGFPYGDFHNVVIKDKVHLPDWASIERLNYTKRLFSILCGILPDNIEGSISTSPISYKHWFTNKDDLIVIKKKATSNLIEVVEQLVRIYNSTGKIMHLNIEPEPDGLIENIDEYIVFYEEYLLKEGALFLSLKLSCSLFQAQDYVRNHIQLCYDICHFAVAFENCEEILKKMQNHNLKIGKLQISAALKYDHSNNVKISNVQKWLKVFEEPTYLHQAIIKTSEGELIKFRDLEKAIDAIDNINFTQLRTHFHVPIFIDKFELLQSTQDEVIYVLESWSKNQFTKHLEVETYTWQLLPFNLQASLKESIERELEWVINKIS